MKYLLKNQGVHFNAIRYLILMLLLISASVAFAADERDLSEGDVTTDGLTVIKCTRHTEKQIKNGVDWSGYTKYQMSPVDVSFRKNWKRDYNNSRRILSEQATDSDMARIKETMEKIVYEAVDKALQKKGGLVMADEADSNTLLFKPKVINLDVYAPEIQHTPHYSETYIRQAGKATLFLEVHNAVSGEILARWVDTREDPDTVYFEWANRITNINRFKRIVRSWANHLAEGLDDLKAVN